MGVLFSRPFVIGPLTTEPLIMGPEVLTIVYCFYCLTIAPPAATSGGTVEVFPNKSFGFLFFPPTQPPIQSNFIISEIKIIYKVRVLI
jgi:hypothetical protein